MFKTIQKIKQAPSIYCLCLTNFSNLSQLSPIERQIHQKLQKQFEPYHLQVRNESYKHHKPGNDTNFNLIIVSEMFNGLNKIKKHQAIYKCLNDELTVHGVHSLTITAKTIEEWEKSNKINKTPSCKTKFKL